MIRMAQNLFYSFLFVFYAISFSQTFEWNNQIQLTRKLSPLRSYKDAQFFRFQIPPELSNAVFRLNASQSELPINVTMWQDHYSAWNITHLSKTNMADTIPITATDQWPSLPSWINATKIAIYSEKINKFYRSVLSTACRKPLHVKFYLRWQSLPLLSIRNATIPDNFIFKNSTDQYVVDLKTDGQIVELNLTNPLPGDWYGMAFINKTNDKIAQKGLERECIYRFKSSVSLIGTAMNRVSVLKPSHTFMLKQSLVIDQQNIQPELLFKFFLNLHESYGVKIVITNCQYRPSSSSSANIRHHPSNQLPSYQSSMVMNNGDPMLVQHNTNFSSSSSSSSLNMTNICPIELNFRALALPNTTTRDYSFNCQTNQTNVELSNDKCIIDLPSFVPDHWNYLQIVSTVNNMIMINDHHQTHKTIFGEQYRTKLMFGSINFTIQLLAGQEAFLYNYFNDQNCQMAAGQNQPQPQQQQLTSTTMASNIMSLNNYNFVTKNKNESPVSAIVDDNSKVNFLSTNRLSNNLANYNIAKHNNSDRKPAYPFDQIDSDVDMKINSMKNEKASTVSINNYDSLEYNEDDGDFIDVTENQISKRSADQNRDRKKQDKKAKEERRLKKQKNKNRQRNRDKALAEKQCQFEPSKIMASLDEDDMVNMTTFAVYNLTRYQSSDVFTFRYSPTMIIDDELLNTNQSYSSQANFIEIDNDRFALFNFTIIPQYDIGGNLEIDFAISPWTNHTHQNVTAILCLTHNRLPPLSLTSTGIQFDEHCYGHLVSNTSQANFTTMGSELQSLVVPYPQSGTWFISILARCYSSHDEDIDDDFNSLMNADFSTVSCDYLNKTSIMIDIHSASCLNSRCLNNGKCQQYMNVGILYSTCSCRAGWKGLVCNDGSEALSAQKLLINFLILTISNAAFIPAIVLAACRRYFTESAIYFITMVSSALYHACDSDFSQSYCVFSVGLLQFADFYTAILSFFVTLLTLACLSPGCKSFFHLMGAISIALITQNDRTSLWTFVIPAGLGTLLMFCCWCSRCCRKSCYPPVRCWIFSICPALILTIVGLIIYAFLETQDNYAITHSVWHGVVALALFLAIPSMPSQNPAENDEEDEDHVHFMSSSGSSTAGGSGKGTAKTATNPETYYELIGEEKSHLARTHTHTNVPTNAQQITKTY
ncbi:hypothetical protein HUG17_10634 [Dermatophagoides farinae]|uniref:EGF-like domain-containing protein n=1 Tax=Dermatophagoides farinae TaxID=6954 RepID=A0A9D4NWR3_DERFA|nr:uncharacterized protein LOC124500227 isoform X1 [Dermatophagoides farinae]XP_046920227.1 uncharacterized protein LOC124500227 isoform X1 [Dermatophagoides farinae]KAH7640154.1 hypothetical protein HUG17_10634 [Dermatophagoides farinae]